MSDTYADIYEAEIFINDLKIPAKCLVQFHHYLGLSISICDSSERINLYVFNRHILCNYAKSALPINEEYSFSGPRLGLYHDTADMREGPYVNHLLEKVDIEILHETTVKTISIKGSANLEKSGVDEYWYRGARVGEWKFSLEFAMPAAK